MFLVVKVNLSWVFGEIRSVSPVSAAVESEGVAGSLTSTQDCGC